MIQKLTVSIFFSAGFSLVNLLGLFALHVLLANLLSAEGFGIFFFTMSLAQILGIVITLGIPMAAVKFVSESLAQKKPRKAASLVLTAAFWMCILTSLSFVAIVLAGWTLLDLGRPASVALACWVSAFALRMFVQEIYRAQQRFILSLAFTGAASIVVALAVLIFWWAVLSRPLSSEDAIGLVAASFLIVSLVGTVSVVVRPIWDLWRTRLLQRSFLPDIRFPALGLPLLLSMLFISLARESSVIVVGLAVDEAQLGVYVWGTRIGQLAFLPAMIVFPMFAPLIVEALAQKNPGPQLNVILKFTRYVGAISLLIAIVIVVAGSEITAFVAGVEFTEASRVMSISAIGYFLASLCGVSEYALMVLGKQKQLLYTSTVVALIALPLTYFAAQFFGIEGAAITFSAFMFFRAAVGAYFADATVHSRVSSLSFAFGWGKSLNKK